MWWKKTAFGLSFLLFLYICMLFPIVIEMSNIKTISYEENYTFFDGVDISAIIGSRCN